MLQITIRHVVATSADEQAACRQTADVSLCSGLTRGAMMVHITRLGSSDPPTDIKVPTDSGEAVLEWSSGGKWIDVPLARGVVLLPAEGTGGQRKLATGGPLNSAGFGGLALAWLGTTILAWWLIRQRRIQDHRRWMVRSYSLTFAAVTLRIYLPLLVLGFGQIRCCVSTSSSEPTSRRWLRRTMNVS